MVNVSQRIEYGDNVCRWSSTLLPNEMALSQHRISHEPEVSHHDGRSSLLQISCG